MKKVAGRVSGKTASAAELQGGAAKGATRANGDENFPFIETWSP